MLRPASIEIIDTLVHSLKSLNLIVRWLFFDDNDEVNIAVKIEIAYRE